MHPYNPLIMGVVACYSVDTDSSKGEFEATLDVAKHFKGKAYTWMVVGITGFSDPPYSVGYLVKIHCGGEPVDEWSQDDQLKDWPQSIEGLLGKPVNLFPIACSKEEALCLSQRTGFQWLTIVDLTK